MHKIKKIIKMLPASVAAVMFFALILSGCGKSDELAGNHAASESKITLSKPTPDTKPLVVYYSRGGKTRIVAQQIAEKLSCETEEIQSKKNRHGFGGILTCVIDQIFNRYDDIQPLTKEINPFNPVIIASPIWIQKISSPVRTFIKDTELLKGKDVYIVLTFNGHLTLEKEQELKSWVKSQGINLKGLVNIVTKKKDEKDLKKDAESIIEIL